ncbi:MAG: hypothetical protein HYV40_06980 [Candidatus Levybacteria bacterium]|nr:hypothetical protein [Candidatus Levybacteria bacterium]
MNVIPETSRLDFTPQLDWNCLQEQWNLLRTSPVYSWLEQTRTLLQARGLPARSHTTMVCSDIRGVEDCMRQSFSKPFLDSATKELRGASYDIVPAGMGTRVIRSLFYNGVQDPGHIVYIWEDGQLWKQRQYELITVGMQGIGNKSILEIGHMEGSGDERRTNEVYTLAYNEINNIEEINKALTDVLTQWPIRANDGSTLSIPLL